MERDLTNWKGCPSPARVTLEGQYVILEPFNAEKHGDQLYEMSIEDGSEERMRYLWEYVPKSREEFQKWIEKVQSLDHIIFYVIIDKASGKVGGRQSFMNINAAHGTAEIGSVLRSSLISRKPAATEACYLFLRYIFDDLGYRRFEWKCHADNHASAKAALRYGFKFEAYFRQHYVMKGKTRDSKWFSIIDKEWPLLKVVYEKWLSPDNFDSNGVQKIKLEDLWAS